MTEAAPHPDDVARAVFAGLPARYDRLSYLLSFGQDRRWRAAVVEKIAAAAPERVLDVATGPAGIALAIAHATTAGVVGVDLNVPMLRRGALNVRADGCGDRVRLVAARAQQLPFRDGSVDAISFSYLLRYVEDPAATLAELGRCLRPGGTMSSLEFFLPPGPLWRIAWRVYTTAILPVLGVATGGRPWWRVGRFLGPSIRRHYRTYPLAWHLAAWQQAGFTDVRFRVMSLGGGLVMWGTKATAP